VAIATVAGAGVAQKAAARDASAVEETLGAALRLVAFFAIPSAVGLVVLARPIVALIYQHGRFTSGDTVRTAEALMCYATGLYAYSAVRVFGPAYYALDRARVPLTGSFLGMAANVLLNILLYPVLGYRGVALGTALAATVNFAVLALAWKVGGARLGQEGILGQLGRVALAAGLMGLVAHLAFRELLRLLGAHGILRELALCLLPVLLAALSYFAAAHLLGVRELAEVRAALRRRRERGALGPDGPGSAP